MGDICDNCPDVSNRNQTDKNYNQIGDACDDGQDRDKDGVPDKQDNCPDTANADQLDSDEDGDGDVCDDDKDNDNVPDSSDNCVIVPNADQKDTDGDGQGDACDEDCDGDGVSDLEDVCPCHKHISRTDFRAVQSIDLGNNGQPAPIWTFEDEGKEIHQDVNSSPGVAIGDTKFSDVEYEGTFFIRTPQGGRDNDWVGAVFSFQV